MYIHIPGKLKIGTAGVAISTDGKQIASNENSIIMRFQQGTGFRLCFTHVNAIFHSIFHKFIGLRRIYLHAKELNLVVIICSLVVGIDCVADN